MMHATHIDAHLLPALQQQEQRLARQFALIGAVLTVVLVSTYQLIEWRILELPDALLVQHAWWRVLPVFVAVVTLILSASPNAGKRATVLLRLLALSVLVMIFGLLATSLLSADGDPRRMIHGLILATFAVSLVTLRGGPELVVLFGLPFAGFLVWLHLAGLPFSEWSFILIEPVMMLGVGLIAAELLYRIRIQSFMDRKRLEQMALTDPLTGLSNRRSIEPQLEGEVSRARRHRVPLSVLLADLDHFKQVNDRHGHSVGDEVLREVARRVETILRREDRAARWGGEEFLILLPETDASRAQIVAEKIRRSIAETPLTVSELSIPLTISLGVAAWHEDSNVDELIRRADQALYRAKACGRNRVCVDPTGATKAQGKPLQIA